MNELEEAFGDDFIAMTFYGSAPYSFAEGQQRIAWYGFSGTPSAMFDGVSSSIGGDTSGSTFEAYQPIVLARRGIPSPVVLQANYVIVGNEITLTASVTVDQAITTSDNRVYFFVAREGLHSQSNMVQAMPEYEPLAITEVGQNVLVQRVFTVDPEWLDDNLRLIVLVQSGVTKEILQATMAVPDYAATVVIDCDPDGVEAPWRLQGPEGLDTTGNGDRVLHVFFAGEYTITWQDVYLWTLPGNASETMTVAEDSTITFNGEYTGGPFTAVTTGPLGDAGASQGAALVDFDNDGDLDIHVVVDGAADQLLRNDGGNVFTDVATAPVADEGPGRGASWADFNRDGFQDVYLAKDGEANILLQGDGSGGFIPANAMGIDDANGASGATWVDFNQDGNLDLYITNQSAANVLLNSYGDLGGGFFVFTAATGAPADPGNSTSASWTDGNLDGLLDLYIINSFTANVMLQNTPIGFDDITNSSGLGDQTNGATGAWGDLDNDGDFDLYLANDGMADRLYRCNGEFLYTQVLGDNVSDMGHGRGAVLVDLDNDMFLDIYVVRHGEPDLLLMNNGDFTFSRAPVGPPEADGPGNTLASGDIDGNGTVDLFITRTGASNVLLSNDLGRNNHWFELRLTGDPMQPDAIGARVVLSSGGVSQSRLITGGSGYQSMSSHRIHFGLADNSQVDQVEIHWPDGTVQTVGPFPADRHLQVTKGEDPASPVDDSDTLPRATTLDRAYPNPFNPSTTIRFTLAQDGPTRLEVFDLNGRLVRTLVRDNLAAGSHDAVWTGLDQAGRSVASGTYFYRLTAADGSVQSGRMVLVK